MVLHRCSSHLTLTKRPWESQRRINPDKATIDTGGGLAGVVMGAGCCVDIELLHLSARSAVWGYCPLLRFAIFLLRLIGASLA